MSTPSLVLLARLAASGAPTVAPEALLSEAEAEGGSSLTDLRRIAVMADPVEVSGPNGPAQTHADDERSEPQPAGAALMARDSTLASGCQELTRLLALYEAELWVFREKEAQGGARDELDVAARRALGASDDCSEVVRHLIRSPASGVLGVFAKVEALCATLEGFGLDQDVLVGLGRSIQDDIARVSPSERSRSIQRSHWLTGSRSRSGDDAEAASQGGRSGAH